MMRFYRPRAIALATLPLLALTYAASALAAEPAAAPEAKKFAKDKPLEEEWPCIARKLTHTDAVTIWDGPAINEKDRSWYGDNQIRVLSQYVLSRRIKEDQIAAVIKKYADSLPAAERDNKLTVLFTAALARSNDERKTVVEAIEKFHKRQVEFSKKIEAENAALPPSDAIAQLETIEQMREGSEPVLQAGGSMTSANIPATRAQENPLERLKWEMRVFQERQQNIPVACEIPGLLEERIGLVARTIRENMSN